MKVAATPPCLVLPYAPTEKLAEGLTAAKPFSDMLTPVQYERKQYVLTDTATGMPMPVAAANAPHVAAHEETGATASAASAIPETVHPGAAQPGSPSAAHMMRENISVQAPQAHAIARGNTFQFGELGMFGRYGAVSMGHEEGALNAQGMQTQPGRAPAVGDDTAAWQPGMTAQVMTVDRAVGAGGIVHVRGAQSVLMHYLRPHASAPASAILESEPDFEMPVLDEPVTGADTPDVTPDMPDAPAHMVIVSGEGDSASVAIRTGDAHDHGKIRTLVEETAAEFGLRITDVHVNGASSFASALGGNHGRRAR